jgi:hypothetical protein
MRRGDRNEPIEEETVVDGDRSSKSGPYDYYDLGVDEMDDTETQRIVSLALKALEKKKKKE